MTRPVDQLERLTTSSPPTLRTLLAALVVPLLLGAVASAQPLPATAELENIVGEGALLLTGTADQADDGHSVKGIGDFNNDGFDDIAISAPENSDVASIAGAVYILFGQTSENLVSLNLDDVVPPIGLRIYGTVSTDFLGMDIDGAGDLNQDGIDDIIIGTPNFEAQTPGSNNVGAAYVIFGSETLPAEILTAELDGSNGFRFQGVVNESSMGDSMAGIGDLNNDGMDDIAMGTFGKDQVSVLFGSTTYPAVITTDTLDGSNGFNFVSSELFSTTLDEAGDVNGDGITDLLIGASRANAKGGAYLVYGAEQFPALIQLPYFNGITGVEFIATGSGSAVGSDVAGIGDFDDDGFDDLAIGANKGSAGGIFGSGLTYLVFGGPDLNASIDLDLLGDGEAVRMDGVNFGDESGDSVAGADFNGDGHPDLITGAPQAADKGSHTGEAYVVFGTDGLTYSYTLFNLDGTNGFKLLGPDEDRNTGDSVGSAGDFNGDGIEDILIGSPGWLNQLTLRDTRGFAHLVFGRFETGITFGSTAPSCPGTINLRSKGLSPEGAVEIYKGSGRGETILDQGSCAGTVIHLDDAELVTAVTANDLGQWFTEITLGTPTLCGTALQILDIDTCLVSNVTALPEE